MSASPRSRRLLAVLLSGAIAGASAFAAPPEGKGNDKHDKKEQKAARKDDGAGEGNRKPLQQGAYFNDRNRQAVVAYYGKQCPPGLAKKNNGCLPPGQAKKQWAIGQALPATVVLTPPPRDVVVLLPAVPRGHQYVQVGGDIVLVALASRMVVDGITVSVTVR